MSCDLQLDYKSRSYYNFWTYKTRHEIIQAAIDADIRPAAIDGHRYVIGFGIPRLLGDPRPTALQRRPHACAWVVFHYRHAGGRHSHL
jgi:hypothetical protein